MGLLGHALCETVSVFGYRGRCSYEFNMRDPTDCLSEKEIDALEAITRKIRNADAASVLPRARHRSKPWPTEPASRQPRLSEPISLRIWGRRQLPTDAPSEALSLLTDILRGRLTARRGSAAKASISAVHRRLSVH
jgi:hypothetical protein